jgi:hypothetical protein
LDNELERRKPSSQWSRFRIGISLAPFCRREMKCPHGRTESTLWCGSAEGAVVRLAAGRLRAGSCGRECSRVTFRENALPRVWPSGTLTSRPAIRVNSESLPGPPTRVLSVTVIKSENERAQPINRPWRPRIGTGRAPFSEKFSGDSRSIRTSRWSCLSRGHHPAQLLGRASTRLPAPQINEQLPGKGDDGPFAGAGVGFGIEQHRPPFLH